MDDPGAGLRRIQVTASRKFPANGLVPWALGQALDEAIVAGATAMMVTEGDAPGGDRQAGAAARSMAARYAAGLLPIPVIHDPVPVTPGEWAAWCPLCADPRETGVKPPRHRRRYHRGGKTTYCPEAGHRRNSAMVAKAPAPGRGLAFFAAGLQNAGTLDCSAKMFLAAIPLWYFCDACDRRILEGGPCRKHSIHRVLDTWNEKTGGPSRAADRQSALWP